MKSFLSLSDKILIVNGSPRNTDSQSAEIIDLNHSNARCKFLAEYPLQIDEASGGLVGNIPVICGGHDGSGPIDLCLAYDQQENQWKSHASLQSKRKNHATVGLPDDDGLWISGGSGRSSILSSTEIIYPNKTSKLGPSLRKPLYRHCVHTLKTSKMEFLVTGGSTNDGSTAETSFLDWDTQQFRSGPTMNYKREEHGCCVFRSKAHQNRPVALVAGSFSGDGIDTAEVLDFTLENPQWEIRKLMEKIFIKNFCFSFMLTFL